MSADGGQFRLQYYKFRKIQKIGVGHFTLKFGVNLGQMYGVGSPNVHCCHLYKPTKLALPRIVRIEPNCVIEELPFVFVQSRNF